MQIKRLRHAGSYLDRKAFHLFGGINVHGLETLVSVNRDVGNKSVQLVGGVFVLVSLSVKSDADSVLDVLDTVLPDGLVQTGVDSDVLKCHCRALETSLDSPLVPMAVRANFRMASIALGARCLFPIRKIR